MFHIWSFEFSSDSPRSNGILDQMEFLRRSNGNRNNGVGGGIYWNWETLVKHGGIYRVTWRTDNNEIQLIGLWRRLMRQSYRGWFYGICFIAWWNEGEGWIRGSQGYFVARCWCRSSSFSWNRLCELGTHELTETFLW